MKIAFYKGRHKGLRGWFDAAVRWWTRGPYSHCELVFSDGMCWSASVRDGGVRGKVIDLASGNWDVFEVPGNEAEIRAWCEALEGRKYDYAGLFKFVWRPFYQAGSRFFCSEYCAAGMKFRDPWRFDPNTLAVVVAF